MKKFGFVFCIVCVAYGLMEAFSWGVYRYMYGKPFSFAAVQKSMNIPVQQEPLRKEKRNFPPVGTGSYAALHPYLGFVKNIDNRWMSHNPLLTQYGFLGEQDPIAATADPDTAIVGIVGASVAEYLFAQDDAREILHGYLDKLPGFKGKKVIICLFGTESYIEPQQFLSIAYYLFQGGRLDLLINLDGKNETLTYYLNHVSKIYPFYPTWWRSYFTDDFNPDRLAALGESFFWKKYRYVAADFFRPARFSITASTFWSLLDDYMKRRAAEAEQGMQGPGKRKIPYFISGPNTLSAVSLHALDDLALKGWVEGSVQLNNLAQTNHFYYFHFLQPDQYVPDSKPLSGEEVASAYDLKGMEARGVLSLYPRFLAIMPAMRARGINVYSLTDVYRHTKETVYRDTCCHVNALGNRVLAQAIGQRIAEYFAQAKPDAKAP